MNFSFDEANNNIIIKNYKIKGNDLIINFLDGGSYVVDLEKKELIISQMIKQATERQNTNIVSNEQSKLKQDISKAILSLFFLSTSVGCKIMLENIDDVNKYLLPIVATISSAMLLWSGTRTMSEIDRLKELKKYSIYLKMRKELENNDDENLYNGVKIKKALNINTIDEYSLKDVRRVNDNIARSNAYGRILSK